MTGQGLLHAWRDRAHSQQKVDILGESCKTMLRRTAKQRQSVTAHLTTSREGQAAAFRPLRSQMLRLASYKGDVALPAALEVGRHLALVSAVITSGPQRRPHDC